MATTKHRIVGLPDDPDDIPDDPPKAPLGCQEKYPHPEGAEFEPGVVYEAKVNNTTPNGSVFISFNPPVRGTDDNGLIPWTRAEEKTHYIGDNVNVTYLKHNEKGPLFQPVELVPPAQLPDEPETETEAKAEMTDDATKSVAEYACPYCPDDNRFTDPSKDEVRRHISTEDDFRHEGRVGASATTRILALDTDGNEIDDTDRTDSPAQNNHDGEITITMPTDTNEPDETTTIEHGNRRYTGPATGLDLTSQQIGDRPDKDPDPPVLASDLEPTFESFEDIVVPDEIRDLSDDKLPEGRVKDKDRRLLTLIAEVNTLTDEVATSRILKNLANADYSSGWWSIRLKKLTEEQENEVCVREQASTATAGHGNPPYEYTTMFDGEIEPQNFTVNPPQPADTSETETESETGDGTSGVQGDEASGPHGSQLANALEEVNTEHLFTVLDVERRLGDLDRYATRLEADAPTDDGEMAVYAAGMRHAIEELRDVLPADDEDDGEGGE